MPRKTRGERKLQGINNGDEKKCSSETEREREREQVEVAFYIGIISTLSIKLVNNWS